MTCNHCGRALRWDEEARPVFLEGIGNLFCCPDCQARARGEPPPEPRRYPVGSRIPRHPQRPDTDLPICGLCRKALPWGQDKGTNLRVRPEFVNGDAVECGGYSACQECVAYWRPRILIYLQRLCRTCNALDCEREEHGRMLAATATERNVTGGMLA